MICIDAGHGGIDAAGNYRCIAAGKMYKFSEELVAYEGVLNRQIAKRVEKLLERAKVPCCRSYTMIDDTPLKHRVAIANALSVNAFVSIHCNAGSDGTTRAKGFEVYIAEDASKRSELLANYIRDLFLITTPLRDRGIKRSNFYVLKNTNCPAVLIECGFFDNPEEFAFLSSAEGQQKIALAISLAITKYFIYGKEET